MKDFYELLKKRRSIRSYDTAPVEEWKIELILNAARIAPSSCNKQPWRIITVTDNRLIKQLSLCAPIGTRVNKWMADAPLVFVICAQPHPVIHKAARLIERDCHLMDIGIAGEHMILMATALGLGSCWIGWFDEKKVRELLTVPEDMSIPVMIVMGYPSEIVDIKTQKRKDLDEIAFLNKYGQKVPWKGDIGEK